MKIDINSLLLKLIVIFPLSTILQGVPILTNLNRFLMFFILILIVSKIVIKLTKKDLFIIFMTLFLNIFAVIFTNKKISLNINVYFYFIFWVFFLIYIKNNYIELKKYVFNNLSFLNKIVKIWALIVIISIFFKTSYNESNFFSPFGCGEHRFASSCLIMSSYIYFLSNGFSKKYIFIISVPVIGILMSGARTYLVIYFVFLINFVYKKISNRLLFYFMIIPFIFISVLAIMASPVGNKMISTATNGYYGLLATVTSGRSMFWVYDLQGFNSLNFFNKLIGNGFDYVYYINMTKINLKIWAHNDFINVLLNFGIIGLYVYFTVLYDYLKILKARMTKMQYVSFLFIWFFNAFFNMVYTYVIAILALPFISLVFEKQVVGERR